MAQWDTYRVALVGSYDTVNTVNLLYFQETVTGNVGSGPIDALHQSLADLTDEYVANMNASWAAQCITVRRLAPGMTEVESFGWVANGQVGGDGLPATNYGLLRMWALPHVSSRRNHIKIPAISESWQEGGQFTNGAVQALDSLLEQVIMSRSFNGYTFIPIRPRQPNDPITEPLPQLSVVQLDPIVRNTRSRNVYTCTG